MSNQSEILATFNVSIWGENNFCGNETLMAKTTKYLITKRKTTNYLSTKRRKTHFLLECHFLPLVGSLLVCDPLNTIKGIFLMNEKIPTRMTI